MEGELFRSLLLPFTQLRELSNFCACEVLCLQSTCDNAKVMGVFQCMSICVLVPGFVRVHISRLPSHACPVECRG